jgi:hypothetical protein
MNFLLNEWVTIITNFAIAHLSQLFFLNETIISMWTKWTSAQPHSRCPPKLWPSPTMQDPNPPSRISQMNWLKKFYIFHCSPFTNLSSQGSWQRYFEVCCNHKYSDYGLQAPFDFMAIMVIVILAIICCTSACNRHE